MSAWCNFIFDRLVLNAIFIPIAILIFFALFKYKEYKNTSMFRFVLTALVISLVSRYMYFLHMNTQINTRYLYPVAFYAIILCVPGFFMLVWLLKYLTRKVSWIKEKHLIILFLMIISIACIGKALNPPDRKGYIQDTAKFIKAYPQPVLISNLRDSRRVAWHSNAELLLLSSVTNIDSPINFESALNILNSKNKNVFLLVDFKDKEFKKHFANQKIRFPGKLLLLKEFKAKHRVFYSLYKITVPEKG